MQDSNIIQQIEQFHSEWTRMDIAVRIGFLISKQQELNIWANSLVNNRIRRGYYTNEEIVAIQQLREIQSELDRHKAEVNQDIYNELRKEFLKAIMQS